MSTDQWWCPGLNADRAPPPLVGPYAERAKVVWHRVDALDGHSFTLVEWLPEFSVRDWVLDADARTLTMQREYIDEERKLRTALLESLRGLKFKGIEEGGDGVVLQYGNRLDGRKGSIRLTGLVRYKETIPYKSGMHATFDLSHPTERVAFVKAYAVPKGTELGAPTVDVLRGELRVQMVPGRRRTGPSMFKVKSKPLSNCSFTSKHQDGSGAWVIQAPHGDVNGRADGTVRSTER